MEKISCFEDILQIGKAELETALRAFPAESVVKAGMGASPEVNLLLEELFPEVDFPAERGRIGAARVEEVERLQAEMVRAANGR